MQIHLSLDTALFSAWEFWAWAATAAWYAVGFFIARRFARSTVAFDNDRHELVLAGILGFLVWLLSPLVVPLIALGFVFQYVFVARRPA